MKQKYSNIILSMFNILMIVISSIMTIIYSRKIDKEDNGQKIISSIYLGIITLLIICMICVNKQNEEYILCDLKGNRITNKKYSISIENMLLLKYRQKSK